jgi:hypothetical protein
VELVIASTAAVMALRVKKSEKRKNCEESKETVTRLQGGDTRRRGEEVDEEELLERRNDRRQ